ncbi:3-phosphoshikimate 1-carboxyvinyltransferase [Hymenobacter saemangeumensis]|uniref:3-phosphoshikimate 1-carboxyvinyltransferase n=1 Tax=Hymenobacter saemangeumensis TaxID=1084522 RepID=A0ABP8ITC6_9BACT
MDAITQLSWAGGPLRGNVALPASKSESNRALILQALAGSGQLGNLSDANDTQLMQRLLSQAAGRQELSAEDAGTVMRFLTAYLAVTGWRGRLTGTARMLERPIAVLVDALRQLGAAIEYEGQEGYPPLRFDGFTSRTAAEMPALTVRGDISSQYISALLMVGAALPAGLRLQLTGHIGSRPYINMTLALMHHFGAVIQEEGPTGIVVQPGGYQPASYRVEADWSAASYWYAMLALAPAGSELTLPGLREHSWQGDQAIAGMMQDFGVKTEFLPEGVRLLKTLPLSNRDLSYDFTDCPDLAQTVAVVAAALGLPITMKGLQSLRIKETDRIAALQVELAKFGAALTEGAPGAFQVSASGFRVSGQTVATYHDHRMAMAFAPLALLGPLQIESPAVVRKSYPRFWDELSAAGFQVS